MRKDITHNQETKEVLFRDEEIYRLIMEHSRDLIRVIDSNFNYVYVSPSHETVLGYTPDEMTHTSGLDILHPDDREMALTMHRELVSTITSLDGLFRFQCKNGQWVTLETRGKSLVKEGEVVGVVTIGRDVTERVRLEKELREHQERLEFLAFHDPLTGLPNRRLFFERTSQAIKDAKRHNHHVAILFLDCDDFKNVNDTHGHYVGDEVITELGQRVSNSVGNYDTVARLSGDEFTILLPCVDSQFDVVEVVSRIMQSIRRPWKVIGHELTLTVSIGAAIYPVDGGDTEELLRHADRALYNAKKQGKNSHVFYDSSSASLL